LDQMNEDAGVAAGGGSGGGYFSRRMARFAKSMKVLGAVTKALYAAGGSLDLTSFAGRAWQKNPGHGMS